jgi:hypothetical protein
VVRVTWWLVSWAIIMGGGWGGYQVRRALRTRHERQLERLEVARGDRGSLDDPRSR